MKKTSWIFGAVMLAALASARQAAASPVACAGGTIDIATTSNADTPMAGTTYNVGQHAIFTAVSSGITPTSYAWTIPGPHVHDYNDNLNTTAAPPAPLAWNTTALTAADLQAPAVDLYFGPSPAQTYPSNGPAETRIVSLTVHVGSTICTVSKSVNVERNLTDPDRQPEDYYTSNHPAGTSTTPGFGHVIDEHMYWHQFVMHNPPAGNWRQFLAWHGIFLRRFDEWRQQFGYPPVAPWYPGRPLPTGPEFDQTASLRLAFDPSNNRISTYFTIAGGTAVDPLVAAASKLADYGSLDIFSNSFEATYHGDTHCNIGTHVGGFFDTSGPGFGSMCRSSSPKDPMFWRWHGFVDRLYRNYCRLKNLACNVAPDPAADPWMGDNTADIAAGGVPPSPGLHYISPDIWNRRSEVTTDACIPRTSPPSLNTVGGVTRNCGSDADHENPVAGVTNYLYATLRNTGTAPHRNLYAEVAVYVANASTGLNWPTDFTMLPESRQFITLNLEPGQVTAIGPLPWTPPSPTPSDHWCIYIRVLSVQETPPMEGPVVDTNVANSNSIAWRNLKIVHPGERMMSRFIVRNVRREGEALTLEFATPAGLIGRGRMIVQLDQALQRAAGEAPKLRGVRPLEGGQFLITDAHAAIDGLRLPPRGSGVAELRFEPSPQLEEGGDIIVTQRSSAGVDGGVTLRVAGRRARVNGLR
jgi:hypothetical protein